MQNVEIVLLLLLVVLLLVLAALLIQATFSLGNYTSGKGERVVGNPINGDVREIEEWTQANSGTATQGAWENKTPVDRETAVEEIYDELMPYVREAGTSKHIEEYLVANLELKALKPDARAAKVKYPKLYQAIDDIVFYYETLRLPDFLRLTALRYEHFLPANKRAVFAENYKHHIDKETERVLRKQFDKYIQHTKYITEKQLDNLIRNIVPGHRYYKLRSGYANKAVSAIRRAGVKALEPDKLALLPVVDLYADWINCTSDSAEVIRVLGMIDTARLRDFEVALLSKLLKRVEFTDYGRMLRKQLKWERESLERQKMVHEKSKIEQEKKSTELAKEQLEQERAKLSHAQRQAKIEKERTESAEAELKLRESALAAEKARLARPPPMAPPEAPPAAPPVAPPPPRDDDDDDDTPPPLPPRDDEPESSEDESESEEESSEDNPEKNEPGDNM